MHFAFFSFVFVLMRDHKSTAFQTEADIASLRSFVLQDSINFRYWGHLLRNHDLMTGKIKGVDSNSQCLFRVNFITDSVVWEGVHQR